MPDARYTVRDVVGLAWCEWPGGPPPTLLMHGVGNYGWYWELLAEAVDGQLRLIAPDARGHGDSDKPRHPEAYASREFVADALAIMDAAGAASALVVGHSMGGGHAARLAVAHPERVRGLVLVDWSPAPLAEGAERARRLSLARPAGFADAAAALAYLRATSPGYSDAVYANRLAYAFARGPAGLVWKSSSAALAAILEGARETEEHGPDLGRIACPTLVVRGTRSTVLSADVARAAARTLRDGRLLELDAGHNVALDRPRELAAAIVAFGARSPA
ncbi:MAG: alpha/beta hydrolase [Chloroflexota bacterium]|nr:alpha/beta hydrolase [Chloroflexota bacterium]